MSAPTRDELQALLEQIGERIGRHLERRGWLSRDAECSHLNFEPDEEGEGLADLQSHSITYRIAFGANQGRKALTLQTLPPASGAASTERVAHSNGCAATSAARRWRASA